MNFDDLTDEDLQILRGIPKDVENPHGKPTLSDDGKYERLNYNLTSGNYRFVVYTRQNLKDHRAYSAGIRIVKLPGNKKALMLSRYNGSNHSHGKFVKVCHIHHTTAASQHDKKPESGNVVGAEYTNLEGALNTLIREYNVLGIQERLL